MQLLAALDLSIVSTSLPRIVGEFDALETMSWVFSAFTLAMAVVMPVYGRLVDRFGSAKMLYVALGIFVAASVLCGFAVNMAMLSFARVLQGIGAAGLNLIPLTLLSAMVPERARPKYIAPLVSVWTISALSGPIIGALITDVFGWRWIFWINAPLGLLALLLASSAMPKQHALKPGKLFDFSTVILFALAASTLIITLHLWAESSPDSYWVNVWLSLAAVVFFVAFFWRNLKSESPLVPMRAFMERGTFTVLALGTLGGASIFPLTNFVPSLLQMGYRVPAWLAGISLLPLTVAVLVANIFSTRRMHKTGKYSNFYIVGTALGVLSMLGMYLFAAKLGPWVIVAGLGLAGISFGLFGQFTITLAQSFSRAKFFGAVTSTVMVSRDFGHSLVATVVGGIFGVGVSSALTRIALPTELQGRTLQPADLETLSEPVRRMVEQAYLDAYNPVFLNSCLVYLVIFALAFTLPKVDLQAK